MTTRKEPQNNEPFLFKYLLRSVATGMRLSVGSHLEVEAPNWSWTWTWRDNLRQRVCKFKAKLEKFPSFTSEFLVSSPIQNEFRTSWNWKHFAKISRLRDDFLWWLRSHIQNKNLNCVSRFTKIILKRWPLHNRTVISSSEPASPSFSLNSWSF